MFCPCPCPWYFCPCPCPRHCWKISFLLFLPLPPFPPCYVTFLPLPLPSISPMKEWNRGQGQGQKNGKTGGKWGQGQKRGQNHKLLECQNFECWPKVITNIRSGCKFKLVSNVQTFAKFDWYQDIVLLWISGLELLSSGYLDVRTPWKFPSECLAFYQAWNCGVSYFFQVNNYLITFHTYLEEEHLFRWLIYYRDRNFENMLSGPLSNNRNSSSYFNN